MLRFSSLTGIPVHASEDSIYIRNYAGFISTASIHLNVLPKICEDVAQAERVLFQMLALTGYLPVKELPLQDFSHTEGLLEHFVQLFAVNLYATILRTPHKDYCQCSELSPNIKGRIDFSESIRRSPILKHLHQIIYDEFTENTLLNQIFKAVSVVLRRKQFSWQTRSKLDSLLAVYSNVERLSLQERHFERIHFNRMNRQYEYLFNLARLFYHNHKPGFYKGDEELLSFMVRLNELFEKFSGKIIANVLPPGYQLAEQERYRIYGFHGFGKIRFIPDLVIKKDAKPVVIIDAKFKNLFAGEPVKFGLNRNDVFQVVSYAAHLGCRDVVLLYPFTSGTYGQNKVDIFKVNDIKLHIWQYDITREMHQIEAQMASLISSILDI